LPGHSQRQAGRKGYPAAPPRRAGRIGPGAAVLQIEIDAMEHAPKLDIAKHRTAINARDMLLRRCGVLAAEWHHPDHITEGAALAQAEEAL